MHATLPGAVPDKQALRQAFRAYRQSLSEAAYQSLSVNITEQALRLPEVVAARTIHVYWPIARHREIDTRGMIRRLHEQGKRVVLPVIATEKQLWLEPHLYHAVFAGEHALHLNPWGIHEPVGDETVPPDALDVIIVPALGAGRNGHRIGYGRGFYDCFLGQTQAPTICLVYAACLLDSIPAEPHDRVVSIIVTENETLRLHH